MSRYRLKRPLADTGTVFDTPGPSKKEWSGETAEVLIALDNDHTVNIVVDVETIEGCPEWFEKVEE